MRFLEGHHTGTMSNHHHSNAELTRERLLEAERGIEDLLIEEIEERIHNLDLDNKIVLSTFHRSNQKHFTEDMVHILKTSYLRQILRAVTLHFRKRNMMVKFELPEDITHYKAAVSFLIEPMVRSPMLAFARTTGAMILGLSMYYVITQQQAIMRFFKGTHSDGDRILL